MTRTDLLDAFRLYAGDDGKRQRLLTPEQMKAFEKVADFLDHTIAERDALKKALFEMGKLYDNHFPEKVLGAMIDANLHQRRRTQVEQP